MNTKKSGRLRRTDIVEAELSYEVMGIVFDVYNTLGPGYSEVYYQRAIALALQEAGLKSKREVLLPVKFHGREIGRQRVDFLVEGRILIELKKGGVFSRRNIEQVYDYLRASGVKLAILINFTHKGVVFKRIVNSDSYIRKDS